MWNWLKNSGSTSDEEVADLLGRLSPSQKKKVLSSVFTENRKNEESIVAMFESFDREFDMSLTGSIRFIYKQLDSVRMHVCDTANLEAATAAGRFLNELASLDREVRKSFDYHTAEIFEGIIEDLVDKAVVYFRKEKLERIFDYPKTLGEFYTRYGLREGHGLET